MTTKLPAKNAKNCLPINSSPYRDKRITSINNDSAKKHQSIILTAADKKEKFKGSKILENFRKHKLESLINADGGIGFIKHNESEKLFKSDITNEKDSK